MTDRITKGALEIATELYDLIEKEIMPGTGVESEKFWAELESILTDLAPKNKALLAKRDDIQKQIDAWHVENKGKAIDLDDYKAFLSGIGYLVPEGDDFKVSTENVDPEIATIAGPQLVVPVMNARYALNAANARWGSLYDALYGTDVISEEGGAERGGAYNPARGNKVIAYARDFLDQSAPLAQGSHKDATGYSIVDGALVVKTTAGETGLAQPEKLAGFQGDAAKPQVVLLKNNYLHNDIQFDDQHPIGAE